MSEVDEASEIRIVELISRSSDALCVKASFRGLTYVGCLLNGLDARRLRQRPTVGCSIYDKSDDLMTVEQVEVVSTKTAVPSHKVTSGKARGVAFMKQARYQETRACGQARPSTKSVRVSRESWESIGAEVPLKMSEERCQQALSLALLLARESSSYGHQSKALLTVSTPLDFSRGDDSTDGQNSSGINVFNSCGTCSSCPSPSQCARLVAKKITAKVRTSRSVLDQSGVSPKKEEAESQKATTCKSTNAHKHDVALEDLHTCSCPKDNLLSSVEGVCQSMKIFASSSLEPASNPDHPTDWSSSSESASHHQAGSLKDDGLKLGSSSTHPSRLVEAPTMGFPIGAESRPGVDMRSLFFDDEDSSADCCRGNSNSMQNRCVDSGLWSLHPVDSLVHQGGVEEADVGVSATAATCLFSRWSSDPSSMSIDIPDDQPPLLPSGLLGASTFANHPFSSMSNDHQNDATHTGLRTAPGCDASDLERFNHSRPFGSKHESTLLDHVCMQSDQDGVVSPLSPLRPPLEPSSFSCIGPFLGTNECLLSSCKVPLLQTPPEEASPATPGSRPEDPGPTGFNLPKAEPGTFHADSSVAESKPPALHHVKTDHSSADMRRSKRKPKPKQDLLVPGVVALGKVKGHPWWPCIVKSIRAERRSENAGSDVAEVQWLNSKTCSPQLSLSKLKPYRKGGCTKLRGSSVYKGAMKMADQFVQQSLRKRGRKLSSSSSPATSLHRNCRRKPSPVLEAVPTPRNISDQTASQH